jgi:hypothetical protein
MTIIREFFNNCVDAVHAFAQGYEQGSQQAREIVNQALQLQVHTRALESLRQQRESLIRSDARSIHQSSIKQFKEFAKYNSFIENSILEKIGKMEYDANWKLCSKLTNLCRLFFSKSFYRDIGETAIHRNAEYAKKALSIFINYRIISLQEISIQEENSVVESLSEISQNFIGSD